MSASAFLGIDIGTSGIRGCCIDENGKELVTQRIAVDSQTTLNDGSNEQDPNPWLKQLDDLITAISLLLQKLDTSYLIKTISIDGTSSTLIACKKDGTAISSALMYNDQQSQLQAEKISHFAPAQCAVHSASSSLAKALLLLARHPETEIFCHQADWLAGALTNEFGISDENNCLKMGYDSTTQSWPSWLHDNSENTVIPVELLPKVVAPGTKLGKIKSALIEKYQLDKNCHLVAGTTDSNAAVLASGANKLGDAVTSLGSTLVIKLFSDKPLFSAEYGIYSHRLNGHWLVGGASNSGGNVLLQHFSQEQLSEMTERLKPEESTDLNYYPLPSTGERFPINDRHKQSKIEPRPKSDVKYFQGLLEGIANIEADGYKKLQALGAIKPKRIFTTGGGSRNSAWRIIRERIGDAEVITATQSEACYGSALLAKQGFINSSTN